MSQRKMKIGICILLFFLMIALAFAVITASATDQGATVAVTKTVESETIEPDTVIIASQSGTDGAEIVPDDNESALIEQALLEQGYLSDQIPLPYDMQTILRAACEQYQVPYALALGLIETESRFKTNATSGTADYGLCQLHKKYFEYLQEQTGVDPKTPEGNVKCGMWLLGHYLAMYENITDALYAYHNGPCEAGQAGTKYTREVIAAEGRWSECMKA